MTRSQDKLVVRDLGRADYRATWEAMRAHTMARTADALDECWLVEHAPVYTLGLKMPAPADALHHGIPIIKTDRGGDITYHGPGQAVVYLLLDLQRRGLPVRRLVCLMEEAVLTLLDGYGVSGIRRDGAPGVYVRRGAAVQDAQVPREPGMAGAAAVQDAQVPREPGMAGAAKIASLGLRVRRGCTYHGIALNVDVDLTPFSHIKPCGLDGVGVTRLADLVTDLDPAAARNALVRALADMLGYALPQHDAVAIQRRRTA